MSQQAHESYVEAQVMTATPQKLRLLLIEGAIRFARQTILHWNTNDNQQALETIIRSRRIVSELLSSIRLDESNVAQKTVSLYLFVFHHLTKAQLQRDAQLVEEAISILEVERDTWQKVCEELRSESAPMAGNAGRGHQDIAAPTIDYPDADVQSGSVSFDA